MLAGDLLGGRFSIEVLAGRGGMGAVYRGCDRSTGQAVAIKVLQADGSGDVARFEREARILRDLDDPRVVRHVAHGTASSGDPYLVMEWLEGEDLAHRLARGRLGIRESVELCHSVAKALGVLHDKGIVHRDLKPSNIFLVNGQTDCIKLVDFGIAQIAEASTRMTGTGTLIGTFGYMAPEQASGARSIDARTDIFALGCVLFECIAGEPAFTGAHPMAILTKILFEEAPRMKDRCDGVPIELDTLVGRFLSKNREDRPQNGRAAASALQGLGDMPTRALEETAVVPLSPALTDSEKRALAVILVSAPVKESQMDDAPIEEVARTHGAILERLLDGSLALLISGTGVATDIAAQAARCAIAISARGGGRRVVLSMSRRQGTGKLEMGRAIDQAAHLLAYEDTGPCVVTIDDASVGLLDARFDVRDASGVYVLSGERDVAEGRTLLGKATPCVGREAELRTLEGLFADCTGEEQRAQVALVTAPPGVGKSRLGREFLQRVRSRGEPMAVWMARGEPLRAGSAFALASQLVESATCIRCCEAIDSMQRKLLSGVARNVPEADRRRVAEFLGEIVGASFSAEDNLSLRAARADAQLMNDQIRAAFHDFLVAECKTRPVLIVLEDLHWGDVPTTEMLGRALADLAELPLFVLALARPEVHSFFPRLWAGRSVQEIRMNELPKRAAERLVRHVLGEQVDAETVSRLVTLSAGNAFYLEELIRATAEGRGEDLPETVVAMVQSRLGVLSDVERRVLRAASIFGETFWAGGVSALLGNAGTLAGKVEEKIKGLVEKEVFIKHGASRFANDTEYAFRHALLREGAYAMLTEEDQALGHRLAGEWLERGGEDDPVVLAEHFEKGAERAKAGEQWARAAEVAVQGNDAARGMEYARRGLACAVQADIRARLLGELCQLHYAHTPSLAAGVPHAEELVRMSEPGSVGWAKAMPVLLVIAAQRGVANEFVRTVEHVLNVEIQPAAIEPAALLVSAALFLLDLSGNVHQASAALKKLEMLGNAHAGRASTALAVMHAMLATRQGYAAADPWGALQHSRVAGQIATTIGHRRYISASLICEGMNSWYLGAGTMAKSIFVDRRTIDDHELSLVSSFRLFVLAWLFAESDSLVHARDCAETLIESSRKQGMPLDEARGHWALAEVLRRTEDLDTADIEIQTSLVMLRMVCPLDVPGALATQAALRLTQGKPHDALASAEDGMAKMEAMGACSVFFRDACLRLVHAQCLEATGNHDAAKTAITTAKSWLLGVANKIGDETYRKSFLENVPENRAILELDARFA